MDDSNLPAVLPQAMRDRLSLLYGRVEIGPGQKPMISSNDAPTLAERTAFRDRAVVVRDLLREADRHDVGQAIRAMMSGFPSTYALDAQAKRDMIRAYESELRGLPLWAIEAGVRSVLQPGPAYPPSHAALRRHAYNATLDLRAEQARIVKVLKAETVLEPTPEQRVRLRALAERAQRALRANPPPRLRQGASTGRDGFSDDWERRLREAPPPAVSPSLQASLSKKGFGT